MNILVGPNNASARWAGTQSRTEKENLTTEERSRVKHVAHVSRISNNYLIDMFTVFPKFQIIIHRARVSTIVTLYFDFDLQGVLRVFIIQKLKISTLAVRTMITTSKSIDRIKSILIKTNKQLLEFHRH